MVITLSILNGFKKKNFQCWKNSSVCLCCNNVSLQTTDRRQTDGSCHKPNVTNVRLKWLAHLCRNRPSSHGERFLSTWENNIWHLASLTAHLMILQTLLYVTFGLWHETRVRLSLGRLSPVTSVRTAPCSDDWTFRQYFAPPSSSGTWPVCIKIFLQKLKGF